MKIMKECKLCKKYGILSDETIKALEESRQGIGINEYSSIEEMINKIKNDDESN